MNRRHLLTGLTAGALLETAEGLGIAPAPQLGPLGIVLPEENFSKPVVSAVTLNFHLQHRLGREDGDTDFSDPYWGKIQLRTEYRWAAVHPHTGDLVVVEGEEAMRWIEEADHSASIYSGGIPLPPNHWTERTVLVNE